MSLIYIVDGYNVMKRSGRFDRKTLKEDRVAFLNYLDHRRPQGSRRNRLIVVFDGRADLFGPGAPQHCEVMFTKGETADEKIKHLVSQSSNVRQIIVVTDDRALGFSVRSLGARIVSGGDFLQRSQKTAGAQRTCERQEQKAELNLVQREIITEELSQIWLKKKSS